MKMIALTLMIVLTPAASLTAQEIDTTAVNRIIHLESQIDSLRSTIRSLDGELQQVKREMVEGQTDFDQLLARLGGEALETAPADQFSRRKRVDALLKAVTQRPGQLRFNGGSTALVQGASGGESWKYNGVGSIDIYAHTAFGPHTILFINMEAIGGNGPDSIFQTLSILNGDAGSLQGAGGIDPVTIREAWAEFSLFNEKLNVTAGKIDLTNYFDNNASANDETMQFISGAFVNSAAFAVPPPSPGIRVRTTLFRRFFLQFGLSNENNSGTDLFDDLFGIGSVGMKLFTGTDWEANLRVYSYQHPKACNSVGYGLSFDEVLFGAFNVFARYGVNQSGLSEWYGIQSAWSGGTRFVTRLAGRTTVFGAAYGEIYPDDGGLATERMIEFYARLQPNKWVHISPHLQHVWHAAGLSDQVFVAGFRVHFNF